jgi:hypothetical protein
MANFTVFSGVGADVAIPGVVSGGELLGAYGNFSNFSSSGATLTQGDAFLSTMGNNPVANNPYSFGDAPSLNNGLGAFAGFAGSRSAQTLRSGSSERAAPANGPER